MYKYDKDGGLRYCVISSHNFIEKSDNIIYLEIRNNSIPTLRKLLDSIRNDSDWKRNNYSLPGHNCQDFVCKVIEKLNCVRPKNAFGRGFHNFSVSEYPYCIVKQMEKNEDDTSLIFDKIPLIGPLEESFRTIGFNINLNFKLLYFKNAIFSKKMLSL